MFRRWKEVGVKGKGARQVLASRVPPAALEALSPACNSCEWPPTKSTGSSSRNFRLSPRRRRNSPTEVEAYELKPVGPMHSGRAASPTPGAAGIFVGDRLCRRHPSWQDRSAEGGSGRGWTPPYGGVGGGGPKAPGSLESSPLGTGWRANETGLEGTFGSESTPARTRAQQLRDGWQQTPHPPRVGPVQGDLGPKTRQDAAAGPRPGPGLEPRGLGVGARSPSGSAQTRQGRRRPAERHADAAAARVPGAARADGGRYGSATHLAQLPAQDQAGRKRKRRRSAHFRGGARARPGVTDAPARL
ncbi:translation initiation factor IF-2-like [Equus quagga]|uniref:translation initiation factor IF-2-like n=1 Tax=Equus quagga TaxID=89248 RepID=UPI001EE2FEAE|nr:translation initiation factor IF-2-like [Equus quagga]